ncbi:K(+)-transporting ATPase subunit C [Viridibacillus sp. FSL R5-0477]|uniref:Potassium-transporting ATPase KdpC subunit n=1 Tax=Viridibacillus arenosi FSL R5-213 TaxID=1227360 RepID=W4F443_9BACL|nr:MULTISPECIES: K(+)-transporting ATPase subunit C [Viridibacillus]ETT87530.1 potassium-transporting ATPase subunit C [Viridibacillus arenosi FSL R5-213]OMC82590.1 potassium-transporting ATPase subunit C [Viridibacillus sp. FSL H8-0123]OMC87669.1 potassium-transporting ATPase subunit C [Viridibacillus sp. FSL H7-0596]OMC91212.1 potassium-transporting ATPase subunit C [Viridibacillus arenosi]
MKAFFSNSKQALKVTLLMFVLCGLLYPFAVTGMAQVLFNHEANGSLIEMDGKMIGSDKLGQAFTSPEFFWGRVSAINYNVYTKEDLVPNAKGETNYNGVSSGTFNYAPSNPELKKRMEADIETFLKANPGVQREQIPADLVTASGSGLDPHISVESAKIQIKRIAQASSLSEDEVNDIVKANTDSRTFNVFGEDKVNVLSANLDIYKKMKGK